MFTTLLDNLIKSEHHARLKNEQMNYEHSVQPIYIALHSEVRTKP